MTELKYLDEDVKAIKSLIQEFFDAINAADTKALGSHFFANANLTIIRQEPPLPPSTADPPNTHSSSPGTQTLSAPKEEIKVVIRTTIEKFIALIEEGKKRREGKPGPNLLEVPDLEATDVKLDALFGSAWSPFKVTFDGVLHHYGIMAYTLGKDDGDWKIEGLTQSYRRTPGWGESTESML